MDIILELYYDVFAKEIKGKAADVGLGGSSMALFSRVRGGIYTKAVVVCTILVDNVGDNIGDIGSYDESSYAALIVASISSFGTNHGLTGMFHPFLISSMGIIICLITIFFATNLFQIKAVKEIEHALKRQLIISTTQMTVGIIIISWLALPSSFIIFNCGVQKEVKNCFSPAIMYGIGVAALSILSTIATGLAIDAYGPISDNAEGIAEIAGMSHKIHERTDAVNAARNTTAAIVKIYIYELLVCQEDHFFKMDAISSEKRSSNKKKKSQFTFIDLEIGSPVLISGPGLKNSGNSGPISKHPVSIETRSGNASDLKDASHGKPDFATNSSKNLSEDLISSSNSIFSIKALNPRLHPNIKHSVNLETSSGQVKSIQKKLDVYAKDDPNLANLSTSTAGLVSCLTSELIPALTSETVPGKASDNKRIMDSANRDGVNSTKDLSSSSSLNPCPCSSISSETSTSMITTSCLKPDDPKTSDCGPTTSQSSCSSSQTDSLDSYSSITAQVKRHTGHDSQWEAIQLASSKYPQLGLGHFKLLKRLGYGDIGSVYLVELKGTDAHFAMKIMDRASIVSRNKLIRAQTERAILNLLDHPFLPTLYSHFETDKFYCLVMEYCSGGNLHSLRQKQPYKYFTEQATRFYASEVLLALEYLHMLGIVYRDLKPENVLVREEGHIMLSDFDLSLQCSVNPTLIKSSSLHGGRSTDLQGMLDADRAIQGCIQPTVFFPRIIPKRNRKSKSDFGCGVGLLPEFIAEPTNARSMSFVGTHEYLAPEIIRGEGHGSAVDWWTFGIFIYELIYGTTPFKGSGNRATLFNVIGQPLRFPEEPVISNGARDLIRSLLVKDPQKRIACRRGATEIKQHHFFDGVNWALVRSMQPPHVPELLYLGQFASGGTTTGKKKKANVENGGGKSKQNHTRQLDFEYF